MTIGVTPSPNFQPSLNRCHSRYMGTWNRAFSIPSRNLPYLGCDIIQWALRWYTTRLSTIGEMAGTTWLALAPVPITPTRLPVRSTLLSHRAVCRAGPANVSRPAMSGSLGTRRMPMAATTA